MAVEVKAEDATGQLLPISDRYLNKVDFGSVEVNSKVMKEFYVTNITEHSVEFNWIKKSGNKNRITMKPASGIIEPLGSARCILQYQPKKVNSALIGTIK